MTVSTAVETMPVIDLDLESAEAVADPYPLLEQVRALGPVVLNLGRPAGYLLTDFKTCQRVMGNHRKFQQSRDFFIDRFGGMVFQAMDTPMHDTLRGIWADEFERERVAARRRTAVTEIIDEQLDELLAELDARGTVDAIPHLRMIPAKVIGRMMGIRDDHLAEFSELAHVMSLWREGMANPGAWGDEVIARSTAATARLNELVEQELQRRESGDLAEADDLISILLNSPVAAEHMSRKEMIATCTHLLFAGNDTTGKMLSNLVAVMGRFPEQRKLIAGDLELIPQAIEEVLRFVTPAQVGAPRTVIADDAEVHGHLLEKGRLIVPLQAAANRDPERWDNPHAFDVLRERKQHLGFGFGMHSCLGQNLARFEGMVFLERIFQRLPDWRVLEPVDYGLNASTRGPVSLNIVRE